MIDNLYGSLLFHDAFPDATVAFALTSDAIVLATESHGPGGAFVKRRLEADDEYIARLVSLVRIMILEVTSLRSLDSHAHGSPFFAAMSRSAATLFAWEHYWLLAQ